MDKTLMADASTKVKREWHTPTAQVFDVPAITKISHTGSLNEGVIACGS